MVNDALAALPGPRPDAVTRLIGPKEQPRGKAFKLTDGAGLFLYITPAGGKLWRFRYSYAGKEKLLSIGPYPATSLADARAAREDAKKLLRAGKDPSVTKKLQRLAASSSATTFEAVAREWYDLNKGRWVPRHADDVIGSLQKEIFPALGRVQIAELRAPEVIAVLRIIEARGAKETARRIRQRMSAVFEYAIATGRAEIDPASMVQKAMAPMKKGRQPALVKLEEVRELLSKVDAEVAHPVTKLGIRILALTAMRPGTVQTTPWSEWSNVQENPLWHIPAERMKLKLDFKGDETRDHLVPLARQTVEAIEALRIVSGRGPLAFPNARHAHKPMSENAMGYLLNRAGYNSRHVPHGFRSSFSSIMNERFPADRFVIDLMLAHVPKDKVLVALDVMDDLLAEGAEVIGPCTNEAAALTAIEATLPAVAVIDVDLGDGARFAVAENLRAKGVPFIIATGYDRSALPADFEDIPLYQKPFETADILAGIRTLLKEKELAMSNSPRLKGLMKIKKTLSTGKTIYYCYAWRGGPLLKDKAGRPLQPGDQTLPAAYNDAHIARRDPQTNDLEMLIRRYRKSTDFTTKAAQTRREYNRYLDMIREKFGALTVEDLQRPSTRGQFKEWRDSMADTPRSADCAWTVLARVLSVAKDRGVLSVNICERGGRLSRSSRVDKVWSDDDIAAFNAVAPPYMRLALLMGLWTGQRQGDLLQLPWSGYDGSTIRLMQSKTKARVVLPIAAPLRMALDAIPRDRRVMHKLNALRREGEVVSAQPKEAEKQEARNELEEVLSYHGGDALAAVQTLLDDCRHLREQLVLTEGVMSRGMARGWKPSLDR
eukprot:g19947.t1